jgi:glycosyltransferase involved in cell wall biosynthesis
MHNELVSLVIPVFNSQDTIGPLVNRLVEELSPVCLFEIVLVNDCSKDRSEKECINLYHQYKQFVRFYSLAKNVGEHNAVMAGLNQTKGQYVVIMDDDFQNPVSEVIKLIDYGINNDCDVVYTYYEEKKHSFFRNLGSRFNNSMANIMLKKPKDLYLSSFKLLNRFIIDKIIQYDLPFPYIDGLILRTTNNIGKIVVYHEKRKVGKSNYTLKKLFNLWMNMFTNFSILPLRISVIVGFIFAAVGIFFGIITAIEKFDHPDLPIGYASLAVAIFIFAGIQLIAIGMLGEYLGRMFLSQNKTPQFAIRKKFD